MAGGTPVPESIRVRGRTSECALLDDMVDAVRGGESRTLLVHGEAGIGKTALLNYVVDSAGDMGLRRAAGVESEMELPFASLHQLCAPLLDGLEGLPPPQRDALGIAFGLSAGPAPDRFLVGLAVLTLLSDAAEKRPLLCIVDDAQWLDDVSAKTLAFVARRLLAEPVGLLFAARVPTGDLRGLAELQVVGLAERDARALLRSAVLSPLDERIENRIVAETQGNPLALLELPSALSTTELAGGLGLLMSKDSLSARLEESFERRVEALSAPARLLLLVVAAEPVGDPTLIWRAAESLGIDPGVVDTSGLLTIAEPVRFRHPLVRSAVYRSAPLEERRRVHLALAEATDRDVDPDRRAWHLSAAAFAPDEAVAEELERSAGYAMSRGGVAAAARFRQRAFALTADPARRVDRALAAAEVSVQAGVFDDVQQLVTTVEARPLDEFQQARVDLLRGRIAFATGFQNDASRLLLRAARPLERCDLELARQTYLMAWDAATFPAENVAGGGTLLEISRAIKDIPHSSGPPRALELLLDSLALLTTDGRTAATPTLQHAAKLLADLPLEDVLRWGWIAMAPSNALWDNDGAYAISERHVTLVRDAGALAELPLYLAALGIARAWTGDLAGAAANMAEVDSVVAATGGVSFPWISLRLRALQGNEAEVAAAILTARQQAAAGAHGPWVCWTDWAAAVLYNGLARYDEAAVPARRAASNAFEFWVSVWVLPELVEAATRLHDTAGARDALKRLVETTQPSANDIALGIEARCRALVSEGTAADDLYRDAIGRLGRTMLRPELARAHLLYGEWLRREGRRVDAREQLRAAYEMFSTIGMEAFAERTRRELMATGEKVRNRAPEARDDLTPQEEQIARLARDGLSNPEIGAQLFLSARTVEWHLRKVYAKLGVTSRRGLFRALADG